jgi:pilus assembly protein CpaB
MVIVIVAVVLGAFAAVLAANYLRGARADIAGENQPVEVLVAQADLPQGASAEQLVEQGLVKIEQVPARFVAADSVSSERVIANQVLASSVGAGEQLTKSRFDYPAEAGLSYTVPEGFVAVSVSVDDVSGVAGLIKPSDNVIVFASYEPSGRQSAMTKLAIGKARVLAVGEKTSVETAQSDEQKGSGGVLGAPETQAEEKIYKTVTLALKASDAQEAAFANEFGTIHLALLPQNSSEPTATASISFKQVSSRSSNQ